MTPHRRGEAGTIILVLTVFLMLLLCFVAFGTEAGRWYLLRAEISKTVDAAALAGARNISNPNVDPRTLAAEFCAENFPAGSYGTHASGMGSATFTIDQQADNRISVNGRATAPAIMAGLLGIDEVSVASAGVAQMQPVEIVMVLDRSGSMSGRPMTDLKVAATSFLDYFTDTQDRDKMGLISFATTVRVDRPVGTNFVAPMQAAIRGMVAQHNTNAEDAIDQADGPQGFTNQVGIPPESRVQQFLIFFSDGRANTFRWAFKRQGVTYDAVVKADCDRSPGSVIDELFNATRVPEQPLNLRAKPTGDGVSQCGGLPSTRWHIFDSRPVPGYGPMQCNIPNGRLGDHACNLASDLAVEHAQTLKDKDVTVFAIGLGNQINRGFLEALASSPQQVYIAPTSSELEAIFKKVAQDIKLRLVM